MLGGPGYCPIRNAGGPQQMTVPATYMDGPVLPEGQKRCHTDILRANSEYFRSRRANRSGTWKSNVIQQSPTGKEGVWNFKIHSLKMRSTIFVHMPTDGACKY